MATVLVYLGRQNSLQVAKKIAEGATEAGAMAVMTRNIQDADLYFLDAENVPDYDFAGKKVALYVLGGNAEKKLSETSTRLDKAVVVDSITLRSHGLPLFQKVREDELIRAKGFGEKTTNKALHQRPGASRGKRRIKGYVKHHAGLVGLRPENPEQQHRRSNSQGY